MCIAEGWGEVGGGGFRFRLRVGFGVNSFPSMEGNRWLGQVESEGFGEKQCKSLTQPMATGAFTVTGHDKMARWETCLTSYARRLLQLLEAGDTT